MASFTSSESQLKPDARYGDKTVSRFINCLMYGGKKACAQRALYDAFDEIAKVSGEVSPLEIFNKAIENVKPTVEVRSKRVGGANYQVPMQVKAKRKQSLAFRWILAAARSEKGKPMSRRLAKEFLDASKGEGKAMTTREQVHRMAEANKAFAHFAW